MREYPGQFSLKFSGRGDAALSFEATGESRAIKITIWDSHGGAAADVERHLVQPLAGRSCLVDCDFTG
jgi:hypothetical protein